MIKKKERNRKKKNPGKYLPAFLLALFLLCLLEQRCRLLQERTAEAALREEKAGAERSMAIEQETARTPEAEEPDSSGKTEEQDSSGKSEEPESSREPEEPDGTGEPRMRVLLMTDDYAGYYHSSAVVEADGTETTYTPENVGEGPVYIRPSDGQLSVKSLERARGVPAYSGTLEIYGTEQGLLLVNELPMEEYLYQVVPSEMPSSYEAEALKAQAVCARTYAWKQYQEEKLQEYHAHVDDSVAFQVYGNVEGNSRTKAAVDETKGKILCQDGEPIQAYYFSTSAGATSTDEVWEPAEEAGYLQSVACVYDAAEPWSQWEVFFPVSVLNERIRDHYGEIGSLTSLEILEKSTGGAVKELRILTDRESRVIRNEYDIRALFSPEGLTITKKDDSTVSGGNLLPSAYFRLDTVQGENGMEGYLFLGGGYGHGVGMSQNGANHMAMAGSTWEEILHYFFRDVTVETAGAAGTGSRRAK